MLKFVPVKKNYVDKFFATNCKDFFAEEIVDIENHCRDDKINNHPR